MNNEVKDMYIPKEAEKEIIFMLHNYKNIKDLIEKRKIDIIDTMKVTNKAHLNAIHNIDNNTLEFIVEKIDTDYNIQRLKKWSRVINTFCSKLYDEEDKFYYYFLKYKYFRKMNEEFIKEKLNITGSRFKDIDIYLKWLLYQNSIEAKLFK